MRIVIIAVIFVIAVVMLRVKIIFGIAMIIFHKYKYTINNNKKNIIYKKEKIVQHINICNIKITKN